MRPRRADLRVDIAIYNKCSQEHDEYTLRTLLLLLAKSRWLRALKGMSVLPSRIRECNPAGSAVITNEGLSLPLELVTSTQAVLARRGAANATRRPLRPKNCCGGQQIAVIDHTVAWWRIESSADGSSPGYPVVVFGGDHADVSLDYTSGTAMAAALVEAWLFVHFRCRLLDTRKQQRFVMDFCAELLRINRSAMHLFIDEADTFAPQNQQLAAV